MFTHVWCYGGEKSSITNKIIWFLLLFKVVAIYSIISTKILNHTSTFYWPIFCNISSNLGSAYLMMRAVTYFVTQNMVFTSIKLFRQKTKYIIIHKDQVYFISIFANYSCYPTIVTCCKTNLAKHQQYFLTWSAE